MKLKSEKIKTIAYPLLIVLGIYIIIFLYSSQVMSKNQYNSYTKQCIAWLNGRLDLGQNYTWLELAYFEGKYYVSFPPFPSYLFLPFVLFWGENNPESFLNILVALIGVIYCTLIASEYGLSKLYTIQLPVFLYTGGAVIQIVLTNGVWFIAQNMALTLSLMSIYHAKAGKKGLSVFALCCAIGCRPFQIIYLPLIINIYTHNSQLKEIKLKEYLLTKIYVFIPSAILVMSYAILNFCRFRNIFEFGHNYLPEFTSLEYGQFHYTYILQNLYNLIRLPEFHYDTKMSIPQYNGMNILICFPIITWCIFVVFKAKESTNFNRVAALCIAIHVLLLVSHKTMGGYHYGNRYIIDVLPAVFATVCNASLDIKYKNFRFFQALFLFGLVFNVIGYVQFLKV